MSSTVTINQKNVLTQEKKKLSETIRRKCARLNEQQEETKTIQQDVVQLILKLAPISKHSRSETKK